MKFIRKHKIGPWIENNGFINNEIGSWICRYDGEDTGLLISMAPEMLDYLIERAQDLLDDIKIDTSSFDDGFKSRKKEFNMIIQLIKKAGVEVVE